MDRESNSKTLKPEIKKIALKDLEGFVESEMYNLFPVVPITPERAKSYLQNPRSQPDDFALYLLLNEGQLVAFRSLFADCVFVKNKTIRFAWCSGSWVHPQFRRKGFSVQLLKEALADWDGKLMLTNYSPETEQLFLKTRLFHPIHQFRGVRVYLFPRTRKLLPYTNKNIFLKATFLIIDFLIATFSSFRILFFRDKKPSEYFFETSTLPDAKCFEYLRNNNHHNFLFNRGEAELNWIFSYPWVSTANQSFKAKYPFSSSSSSFYYHTVKIFNPKEFAGFFIFSVREGHLKTLFFCHSKGVENEVFLYLKRFCVQNKIELATLYNSVISQRFFNQKFPFLRAKKFGLKIYSSFQLPEDETYRFQDGDGDVFFT